MKKVKLRLLFLVTLFFACALQAVANDTIKMIVRGRWAQSHYITATAGEQFKVIYGDGKQQIYTGTGVNQNILYQYLTLYENNISCTIIALSENCKFTRFHPDGGTISLDLSRCPSIVHLAKTATKTLTNLNLQNCINLEHLLCSYNPLYNLDISDCKALKTLLCSNNNLSSLVLHDSVRLDFFDVSGNHLSLSNLHAITLQTYPSSGYYGFCCCQTLPQIDVELGELVDFSSENEFEGIYTNYWLSRDGEPVSESNFTFNNGVFAFHYFGNYLVTRLNYAIPCGDGSSVSNPILVKSNTSDATLASLKVNNCGSTQFELNPEYQWDTFNYEVDVNYRTSFVCISATPSYPQATVSGNGTFQLTVGENIFPITVTSADSSAEFEYTVTVNRAAPNTDATLLNLAVSTGELTPEFSSMIYDYTVDVAYRISGTTITATANDSYANINGSGYKVLAVGENIYTITVTAEDGATTLEYTVTVNRAAPNTDATLSNLSLLGGELTPEFSSTIYDYSMEVPFNVSLTYINATVNDPNASVSGTGEKQLAVGENIYTITATAEDGVTKLDYTVTVNRTVGILESTLAGIGIYPNPTTGELRIESGELRIDVVEIYDVSGGKLLSFTSQTSHQHTFDISHLNSGTYFVKIITEQGEIVKKMVKL